MMVRGLSRAFRAARMTGQRLWRDQSGSVLSFLVVIPVLMGAAAVGVETGQLYRTKRQMQSAADDAALAGSIDSMNGKNAATISATASYEAQRNGFQNGVNGVTVAVHTPPTQGANVATPNAVEVVITKSQHLSLTAGLASFLGVTTSNVSISSRSVAAQSSSSTSTSSAEGCLVALTPAAEQGVNFSNFSSFTADCTIISNGTSTNTGSTASVYMSGFSSATVKSVWTRGSFVKTGYSSFTATNGVLANQATAVADPYASLPTPSPGTCGYTNYTAPPGSTATFIAGTYCGGLTISGFSSVVFNPGTYYIANGDLYISGVSTISCPSCTGTQGVTFVLTQTTGNAANIGGVNISSDSTVTLKAPTQDPSPTAPPSTNPYLGVLFYQDRGVANGTMSSTSKIFTLTSLSSATLTGAIYFPNNRIDISNLSNASSSSTGCTVWIGRYLKFTSFSSTYAVGCDSLGIKKGAIVTTTTTTKGKVLE